MTTAKLAPPAVPAYFPDGVAAVTDIEESGPLIRLTKEVDLDELLVAIAMYQDGEVWRYVDDDPTRIHGWEYTIEIAWYRTQPCNCGEGVHHQWDMAKVSDDKPTDKTRYGAFLGVYIR